MSDEVDDLLRRTMANLDRQVPAGYFDTLPDRTLARLDATTVPESPAEQQIDDLARERALRGAAMAVLVEAAPAAQLGAPAPVKPRRRAVVAAVVAVGVAAAAAVVVLSLREEPSPARTSSVMTKPSSSGTAREGDARGLAFDGSAVPGQGAERPSKRAPGKAGAGGATLDDKPRNAKTKKPAFRASLSKDDFERAMAALAAQVRACGDGTRGSAQLQVRVSPSGRVAAATVSGVFAGTPVAACVERAVRSATFPPWDGAPETLGYSYLLSE